MSDSYSSKRDFSRTPEPRGGRGPGGDDPMFVIQKHDASTLHYDFRLQVGAVLKSWVVPKGLSTDPRDKRLAIPTEDHPLAYADFEGVIPQGEYGGGTVLVWDRGTYENITGAKGETTRMADALDAGHALVRLHGLKLRGGYALQRIESGDAPRWLVVKIDDDAADARRNPVSTQPRSVLSGRTIEDVASDERGDA